MKDEGRRMKEEIEGEAPERARVERLGHFHLLPSAPKRKRRSRRLFPVCGFRDYFFPPFAAGFASGQ
jgi:hypothetical protein